MREVTLNRKTAETDISLSLNIDGKGNSKINSGNGFFDHMLTLLAKHAKFDLDVVCNGDTFVDFHHSAEDIGIVLGDAFKQALGNMAGITRFADTTLPMDEALILTAVDISGRGYLGFDLSIPTEKIGDFDSELVEEFFMAFCRRADVTLHIKQLAGRNAHHIVEGTFKSFAQTLKKAVKIDENFKDDIPSTKGVL
ncbi:MAG: imidazoleglycerol-phosphate dehydratase HisB [Clostridia bacterium]|nr:imidazoleglycerol-phosphate dehydratase HisB [Clostridia bacterium]